MSQPEQFDILILGSGKSGKLLAWHMAQSGRRAAVVERRWIGGSCPNIACLPSKNEIWSAKVAHLARAGARFGVVTGPVTTDMATVVLDTNLSQHAAQFGTMITGPVTTDMAKVRQRKRNMVEGEIAFHLHNYQTTGGELIMGTGRFVAPKMLEVHLNDGGTRVLAGDRVFINVGTHAAIPPVPGLEAARPLTHIEALELDYLPAHLIVLGAGYVGLELAQAYRRFGSRVTVIEPGPQLMGREDPDVAAEMQQILNNEGIRFLLTAQALDVRGLLNVQMAVKDERVWILEANPRASRTVPYVSKATGVPLAKIATLVMAGAAGTLLDARALEPLVAALRGPATVYESEQSSYKDGLYAERWIAAQCGVTDVETILPEHWRP